MKQKLHRARNVWAKLLVAALPIIFVSIGCKKEEDVRSFQAPKDLKGEATAQDVTDASGLGFPGDLRWKLPADWKQVEPPPARMGIRAAAAIQVSPDDSKLLLTMSPLPADKRTIPANIDRWSGMVHLPAPTTAAEMEKVMTPRQNGDVSIFVVDMSNPAEPPLRLLGAIILKADGSEIWAMKVTGPADEITSQKSRFDDFLGSIQFSDSAVSPTPTERPEIATGTDGVTWALPAGWTAEAGAPGSMRTATIHPGGNGATEIKVSKLGSIGGGLGANVTRWRGEVGLSPVTDQDADAGQKTTLGQTTFTIHDYSGPAKGGTREIVALTELNGVTWYFKLIGPTDAVTTQKPAFDQFLVSLRFAQ